MIVLYFDTETTGIKTKKDPQFKPALVQLGCILQDQETGRVLAELNLIANQYTLSIIPTGAIAVHGIDNEMAKTYGVDPKLIDLIFAELVKKADLVVAHNFDYDEDVVHDNLPISARALDETDNFCTMNGNVYIVKAPLTAKQLHYFSSKGAKPEAPYKVPNLTETHLFYFGEAFIGAHDAMADIRACRDIFQQMLERGYFEIQDNVIMATDKLGDMIGETTK